MMAAVLVAAGVSTQFVSQLKLLLRILAPLAEATAGPQASLADARLVVVETLWD
jgi:hypothetical protein